MSKDTRIAFRTTMDLKERLGKVSKTVRLSDSQLAEACVEALVEYIEEHGEITLPLALVPKSAGKKVSAPRFRTGGIETPSLNEGGPPAKLPPPPREPPGKYQGRNPRQ